MDLVEDIKRLHESKISRSKAAKALNVPLEKFDLMLESLGIEWKRNLRGGRYTIEGKVDTLEGHSERLGISVAALRWRLSRQQQLDKVVQITPVTEEETMRFVSLRKEGYSAQDAASEVGRPYNTLKNAAKRFCPDYDQVVKECSPNHWRVTRARRFDGDDELACG